VDGFRALGRKDQIKNGREVDDGRHKCRGEVGEEMSE